MPELPRVWINGVATCELNVFDRGLSYGDGFFTTALVHRARWLNAPAHRWRIEQSCTKLAFPQMDYRDLLTQVQSSFATLCELPQTDWVLKLMFTRGIGGRGYQPAQVVKPTVIIQWLAAPTDLHAPPLVLRQCLTPSSVNPALAGIKHLNRLENVMAKHELAQYGLSDGLMLNAFQEVVCSTQANLFLLHGNALITPRLTHSGVAGTVRFALQSLSGELGYVWHEQVVRCEDLRQADALFLSNAIRGIMPVAELHFLDQSVHRYGRDGQLKIARIAAAFARYQSENAQNLMD